MDGGSDPVLADFFAGLDRDDRAYRGGVRYYPSEKLRLGAGVGHGESVFAADALERSNSGDFWYVETGYERPKLLVDLLYQENRLKAKDGSEFTDFDSSTGGARIEWKPRESFSARLYGSRQLAYSLLVESASGYVDQRVGAGVDFALGWRMRLDLYGETGSHRYQGEAGTEGADRVDDAESYGIDLRVELRAQDEPPTRLPGVEDHSARGERPARPEDLPDHRQSRFRLRPGHLVLSRGFRLASPGRRRPAPMPV